MVSPEDVPTISLSDLEDMFYNDLSGCVAARDAPQMMLTLCNFVKDRFPDNEWLKQAISEYEEQTAGEEEDEEG